MNDRQLRYFGASLVAMMLMFAALAHWKWQVEFVAILLAVVAVVVGLVYYLVPTSQRSIYQGFLSIVWPIQLVMSAIILAIVYYGVLTPIGIILQLVGISIRSKEVGSNQNGAEDSDDVSYWTKRKPTPPASRYFDTY